MTTRWYGKDCAVYWTAMKIRRDRRSRRWRGRDRADTATLEPDVVVMDINMPKSTALRRHAKSSPPIRTS